MSDRISIVNLNAVRDPSGGVLIAAKAAEMLIPYVTFADAMSAPLDALDAWWDEREPALRAGLVRFLADPPSPVDMPGPDEARAGDAGVGVPIPLSIAHDPEYDVVGEIVPEIQEAILQAVAHAGGDHSRCRGMFQPCEAAR